MTHAAINAMLTVIGFIGCLWLGFVIGRAIGYNIGLRDGLSRSHTKEGYL